MGFVQNELYYIGPYNKFCPTLKQSSSTQPNVAMFSVVFMIGLP